MKRHFTFLIWAAAAASAPSLPAAGNLRVLGATQTQAIVAFEKPQGGTVTIEVSESPAFASMVRDVDATLFPGANQDTERPGCIATGSSVTCVIGKRTVEMAADGKAYSRALRAATTHYFRVTWPDASQETVTQSTRDPILGSPPHDAWPMDPANKGKVLWPTQPLTDRNAEVIDPFTGIALRPFGLPTDVKAQFFPNGDHALANCWQGASWTLGSPCGALNGTGATYSENTQDFLSLGIESISADGSGGWRNDFLTDRWGTNPMIPRWMRFRADIWFTGMDLAPADREVEICWGRDDMGCTSPPITITAGTTQSSVVICNGTGTATCTEGDLWGAPMPAASVSRWSTGKVYNAGSSTTVNFTDANDCNRLKPGMTLFVNTGGGTSAKGVESLNCSATPPTATVSNPVDLTPPNPGPSLGWPFFHPYGLVRNTAFSFLVRKKSTTANNTLHIANAKYGIGAGGLAVGSSTGEYPVCSGESKLSAAGFMHCMDLVGKTYALHPVTGEVRYIGTPVANLAGVGRSPLGTAPVLWEDANTWWALASVPGGGLSIFKATLALAAQNDDASAYVSVDGGDEAWYDATVVNMFGSNKIGDLIQAFDPAFDKTLFVSCSLDTYNIGRYLAGGCRIGNQDTYAWAWVYDTGNKLPLGSGGDGHIVAAYATFSSATKTAWTTQHNFGVTLDTSFVAPGQTIAKEDTAGNQKFWVSFDAWWTGSAWSATTMPNNSSVRIRLTSSWNPAWGAAPASFQSGDPVSSTQSPHWLQKLAVGNYLWFHNGEEHYEITAINGQDAAGLDLTVNRRACLATEGDSFQTISVGTQLHANKRCDVAGIFWDFLRGPHGEDASLHRFNLPGGGHQVTTRYYGVGTPEVGWIACDIETNPTCFPYDSTNATQVLQRSEPAFAGKTAPIFGSCHEGHPGFYPEAGGGPQRVTDMHPFVCGYTTYTVTWVTGDLFKMTNPNGFPLNRKHFVTMVSMGFGLTGRDISGASSSIDGTSAYAYDFCVVLAANECRPGSVAGEIYVNHPGFGSKSKMCSDTSTVPDDLCVEDTPGQGQSAGMYILAGLDNQDENKALFKGREWMALVQEVGLFQGKGNPNTSNVKMLSLNWGWYGPYLVRLPRSWTLDDVNRAAFVPVEVQIGSVPAGTSTASVEFGYAELNASGLSFPPCTTRQESCIATQPKVANFTPFFWASETFTELSCASGCTVAIPGISGRVVYYRVRYRDAGGQLLATEETRVAVVP